MCSQEAFMENYFSSQRHNIFRNVAVCCHHAHPLSTAHAFNFQVLIYIFDVESRDLEKDFHYFSSCLTSIAEVRPN